MGQIIPIDLPVLDLLPPPVSVSLSSSPVEFFSWSKTHRPLVDKIKRMREGEGSLKWKHFIFHSAPLNFIYKNIYQLTEPSASLGL